MESKKGKNREMKGSPNRKRGNKEGKENQGEEGWAKKRMKQKKRRGPNPQNYQDMCLGVV